MPKGIRIPETVKNDVRRDYYEREMTVSEIAAKYGLYIRRIYDYVKPDRHGAYAVDRVKKMTYLSRDEVELVLLMLCECDSILEGKNRIIAKTLEDRMLMMADAMTDWRQFR